MNPETSPDVTWEELQTRVTKLRSEIARVIVGQEAVVEMMTVSLLCKGHCLLIGVPGLAKTLLISTLGSILGLKFHRIQFTPDLMPTDILGSEVLQQDDAGRRSFEFKRGPIFANLILADEINRTPPKTQAALLEAMQEKQVTVAGHTSRLSEPFIVFATQNPIEHEGTYPLPEAQLDRFFFCLKIDYPTFEDEREVVKRSILPPEKPEALFDAASVIALQETVREVPLPDHVLDYLLRLVHATRPKNEGASDYVKNFVEWGAGPRASLNLSLAARALALLRGKPSASVEEVQAIAPAILRHRVVANYNATGEGITVEDIIGHLLKTVRPS